MRAPLTINRDGPEPFLDGWLRGTFVGACSLFVGLLVAETLRYLGVEKEWTAYIGLGVMFLTFVYFRPTDG